SRSGGTPKNAGCGMGWEGSRARDGETGTPRGGPVWAGTTKNGLGREAGGDSVVGAGAPCRAGAAGAALGLLWGCSAAGAAAAGPDRTGDGWPCPWIVTVLRGIGAGAVGENQGERLKGREERVAGD